MFFTPIYHGNLHQYSLGEVLCIGPTTGNTTWFARINSPNIVNEEIDCNWCEVQNNVISVTHDRENIHISSIFGTLGLYQTQAVNTINNQQQITQALLAFNISQQQPPPPPPQQQQPPQPPAPAPQPPAPAPQPPIISLLTEDEEESESISITIHYGNADGDVNGDGNNSSPEDMEID